MIILSSARSAAPHPRLPRTSGDHKGPEPVGCSGQTPRSSGLGRRAVGLAAALITLVACSSTSDPEAQTGFVPGDHRTTFVEPSSRKPAPDLSGRLLGGGTYSLAEDRGDDIVVINVWGSWCAPCNSEAPVLQEVYEEVRGQGVQFLGINTRDSDAAARTFVRTYGITYPSLVDEGGELQLGFAKSLPIAAIPTTLIIDRQGRVAARALSELTYDGLLELLRPVLEETPASSGPSS